MESCRGSKSQCKGTEYQVRNPNLMGNEFTANLGLDQSLKRHI